MTLKIPHLQPTISPIAHVIVDGQHLQGLKATPRSANLPPHHVVVFINYNSIVQYIFDHSLVRMNILEDQVSDLNYLAESPIAISSRMNDQRHSSSAESPAHPGNESGKKRKADDASANGATHTRAKRNRYISIAWYV
jgi:hypothetical protein